MKKFLLTILAVSLMIFVFHAKAQDETSATLRTLTEQNLIDILVGSCIQSTRNCDPSESIAQV